MMGHVTTEDDPPLYIISSLSIWLLLYDIKSQFWLQIRKVGRKVTSRIMTLKSLELSLGSGTYIKRFLCKDVAQGQGRQSRPWEHNFDIPQSRVSFLDVYAHVSRLIYNRCNGYACYDSAAAICSTTN